MTTESYGYEGDMSATKRYSPKSSYRKVGTNDMMQMHLDMANNEQNGSELAPLGSNSESTDQKTQLLKKEKEPWTDEHRDLGDGGYRAAIFGFSDGLVTNLCLILGVQFALEGEDAPILVAGISGLIAGAFSMAIGEWISMKAQAEALEAEISLEHKHLSQYWREEMTHLREILQNTGLKRETIDAVVKDLKNAPRNKVVDLHARLELGIDPDETGNALKAALLSFALFCFGALIPLIPYIFLRNRYGLAWKISLGVSFCFICALGYGLGKVSKLNPWKSMMRQIIVVAIAVAGTIAFSFATDKIGNN